MPAAPLPSAQSEGARSPRRAGIVLGIAAAILLALGTIALLLHAALKTPSQQHVLVVRSGPAWQGVDLIVESGSLPEPKVGTIDQLGRFTVPFFLPPGEYTLKVRSQGEFIYSERVNLNVHAVREIDLTRAAVTTQPSTRPTTRPE
jgi:hypothetical protein